MFYAYLSGGGGCDYTLDCNKKLVRLKAQTWEEADKEASGLDCQFVEEITILKVAEERKFDLCGHRRKQHEEESRHKAVAEEAKARQEYERLRKRFGQEGR